MSVRKKKQAMSEAELEKLLGELPPPTWDEIQRLRKRLRSETRKVAIDQIARAMPEGSGSSDSHPSFQDGALLATFLPNDGQESTLARLMIAAMNTAMDCHARANSDAAEVRGLELNYAIKLSVVTAALSKAFDQHRASKKEDFIDDTIPIDRYLNFPTKESSEPAQDQTSGEKPDPSAKEKD